MADRKAVIFVTILAAAAVLAFGLLGLAKLSPLLAFAALILVAIAAFLFPAFEQVKEYERAIVFRFGKYSRTLSPGLFVYFPAFESIVHVDMRVKPVDIPPVQILTKDNVGITIDTIVLCKVTDAKKSTVEVKNYDRVIADVVISELRTIVGKIDFEDLTEKVEDLNILVRNRLAQFEPQWGVSVTRIEVENIIIPPALLESMTRRKSSEEFKARVRIEAEARQIALDTVNAAASKLTPNTLRYLYFDTLKRIADGKATKVILPVEMTKSARTVGRVNFDNLGI